MSDEPHTKSPFGDRVYIELEHKADALLLAEVIRRTTISLTSDQQNMLMQLVDELDPERALRVEYGNATELMRQLLRSDTTITSQDMEHGREIIARIDKLSGRSS